MLPSALLPDVYHENVHDVVRIRIRIYFRQVKVYKRANNRLQAFISFSSPLACHVKSCTELSVKNRPQQLELSLRVVCEFFNVPQLFLRQGL